MSDSQQRQDRYLALIDQVLSCPAGQEPEVLDTQPDLLDSGLVQLMVQVASVLAHENNQDAAQCLIHVAKELAKQLGLYPQVASEVQPAPGG
jgi:hypothetical protein